MTQIIQIGENRISIRASKFVPKFAESDNEKLGIKKGDTVMYKMRGQIICHPDVLDAIVAKLTRNEQIC